MIRIRRMTVRDIPRGMELKDQAGWNQTEADWRRILDLEPDGCFAAELDDRVVGTVAAAVFGPVGWIAVVLVDAAVRGRGIGTRLVEQAVTYLQQRGVKAMRLDATPLGMPIYQRLGFVPQHELARWEGIAPQGRARRCVRPVRPDELETIARLDEESTGNDRRRLIRLLHRQQPGAMQVFVADGNLVGYATRREGSRAVQLGPAIARSEEAGRALCEVALMDTAGRLVFIDILAENSAAAGWAKSKGLAVQRRFARMYRGRKPCDRPPEIWATSGPENG